jgi:hypothetical protein
MIYVRRPRHRRSCNLHHTYASQNRTYCIMIHTENSIRILTCNGDAVKWSPGIPITMLLADHGMPSLTNIEAYR